HLHSHKRVDRIIALLACATTMVCLSSCRTSTMRSTRLHLDFLKDRFPPQLTVLISNSTGREIRIWKQENSWGWENLVVELREKNSSTTFAVKRKQRTWTQNGPGFITIPPQQTQRVELELNDGWWEVPGSLNLTNRPYQVRVSLNIKPSP